MVRKSLESPYSEPHRIISRPSDRVYEIDVNGIHKNVSVENIKLAFFIKENNENLISKTVPVMNSVPFDAKNDAVPDSSGRDLNVNRQTGLRTYSRKKKEVTFSV